MQLYVGTKRGLFVLRSADRTHWDIAGPLLEGREVYHAWLDPRDRRTAWAATDHAVWGAHVHRSDDAGRTWTVLAAAPHHADERGLEAIWALAPGATTSPETIFAGIEPAGLFRSDDRGATWQAVAALNDHSTNTTWQPAGGGLALHSIHVDLRDARRMWCALSAGGVYATSDAGASWSPANVGVRADFLNRANPETGQCVHKLRSHPARPDRLYQQNHCGTYRSDDAGATWVDITAGLPSDFGYALAVDPRDADTAFVVPEQSSHMRTVVDGKLRVYRTTDAGASWQALTHGLPQEHAYVTVLREALDSDPLDPRGVYLGTSSGHLFGSVDRGHSWRLIAGFLPRILSVTAAAG